MRSLRAWSIENNADSVNIRYIIQIQSKTNITHRVCHAPNIEIIHVDARGQVQKQAIVLIMVHARSSHVGEVFISSSGTSPPVPNPSDAGETTSHLAFGKPLSFEGPSRPSFSLPLGTLVYTVGHLVSGEDLNQIEDLLHATKMDLRTHPVFFPKSHKAVAPE